MTKNVTRSSALPILGAVAACASPRLETYASPEEAMRTVAEVAGTSDDARKAKMFGPDWAEFLQSGDDASDREDVLRLKTMILQKIALKELEGGEKIAEVGNEGWPFPFPIVREGDRWTFDVEAGKDELLNRRIGRNELETIATLREYVDAQREYFEAGRDGNPPAYAQFIFSDEGRHNGLYWPTGEGEADSPLGPLVAEAATHGYRRKGEEPIPYQGYHFRILTGQGKRVAGGAKSYIDGKGLMTGGFAAIAWPATYGNSGVMTFLVNQRGIVLQKDLGEETSELVEEIKTYDPDSTWRPSPD
ncbi:MAG: DUF2950 domain-containing protein [Planctomycetes bacterium]|nr:DUF2950 domain-containing protein [Planctomycetota bacterium]